MSAPIVVIKLGSNALLNQDGRLDLVFLDGIAGDIAALRTAGLQPVVVSSGAVACGLAIAGLAERPESLPERQALAAMGQAQLMHHWQQAFAGHACSVAQLLLTADDFSSRDRYLNLTATLRTLGEYGAVPIINENDVVAVQELTVGDNDHLSALVASQLGAEHLFLLTDIDGVYDADPRSNPQAQRLKEIERVTPAMLGGAGGAGRVGRGGMRSKLLAGRLAASAGVTTHICHARAPGVLSRSLAGEALGTRILPRQGAVHDARRRWLAIARAVKGSISVDAGAVRALSAQGRSLLPAGIRAVDGRFKRGDTVRVLDESGNEIARGLVSLSAEELGQVLGQRMDSAARTLGYALPKAAIHRDNLLLV